MQNTLNNALVFYSRIPDIHLEGKTRIGKIIENQTIANELARSLILDMLTLYGTFPQRNYDLIFFHKGHRGNFVPPKNCKVEKFIPQIEDTLPINMQFIQEQMLNDYKKVIIVGSDIPLLHPKRICKAFKKLDHYDMVFNPVEDGGYCLVGMKEPHDIYSSITNWNSHTEGYHLFEQTLEIINSLGLKIYSLKKIYDIDLLEDVQNLWKTITYKNELEKKYSYLPLTYMHLLNNGKIYKLF